MFVVTQMIQKIAVEMVFVKTMILKPATPVIVSLAIMETIVNWVSYQQKINSIFS